MYRTGAGVADLIYNPERLPDEVLAVCIDPPEGKGLRGLRVVEPSVLLDNQALAAIHPTGAA